MYHCENARGGLECFYCDFHTILALFVCRFEVVLWASYFRFKESGRVSPRAAPASFKSNDPYLNIWDLSYKAFSYRERFIYISNIIIYFGFSDFYSNKLLLLKDIFSPFRCKHDVIFWIDLNAGFKGASPSFEGKFGKSWNSGILDVNSAGSVLNPLASECII